ncbi:MAG: HAD-IIIA family hydrolase [Myxococcales bacterium]|nr:HAD-IIIA family hydrolase [Myxococcales bacterium]
MSDPAAQLSDIKLLVCDVDGVLTDGRLTYSDGGEATKTFHVRDGMGLRMLMDNGIEVAIITARSGAAVAKRMSDLKIKHVVQGRGDKGAALQELLDKLEVPAENAAYIGDDIIDIPAIRLAGLGVTVANGHAAVLKEADLVTERNGGEGAVREVCDAIVDAQVGLDAAIAKVLEE